MFLFLSSDESYDIHKSNTASDFVVELSKLYTLTGKWEIALTEIHIPSQPTSVKKVVVMCDLCEYSSIKNSLHPVLRKMPIFAKKRNNVVFPFPYYFPIIQGEFSRVRVTIRDEDLKKLTFTFGQPVRCVLHIKQV